ncbi:uncharacterized protein N7459_004655 [Penicillium hispanicum]|uniref:uncharacterized protein n=1 Tax=Penicillium hispanicum TaxID=1080232 RepID=UPI0025424888|nr:uncharacterized protein N7459_004655 [Penicillium hispanicum]KAJ5584855.1 hypothetical protein N7459_004655 [Penicillium hispanicum]
MRVLIGRGRVDGAGVDPAAALLRHHFHLPITSAPFYHLVPTVTVNFHAEGASLLLYSFPSSFLKFLSRFGILFISSIPFHSSCLEQKNQPSIRGHPDPRQHNKKVKHDNMANAEGDLSDMAAEATADFFNQLFETVDAAVRRFFKNFYASFAEVSMRRWTKVILSVIFYILIRPYIEKFFKYLHDRERRKEKEKKEAQKAALGGKKAKMSANALRGGESGKVLGEVDNTEDEVEDDEENELAQASGVPEWNGMARKRQKRYLKNLKKENGKRAEKLSEDQMMELLDWSESEDEKKSA